MNDLLKDIVRNPFNGSGKPEPEPRNKRDKLRGARRSQTRNPLVCD